VLDFDTGTYVSSNTKDFSMYDGEFQASPDNLVRTEEGKFLYFTQLLSSSRRQDAGRLRS